MVVIKGVKNIRPSAKPRVVTIGVFDGVHLGHQRLIKTAVKLGKSLGQKSMVITFHPDPEHVLNSMNEHPPIQFLEDRLKVIGAFGIDEICVVNFTHEFALLNPVKFIEEILIRRFRPSIIVVGNTFSFGHNRSGDFGMLKLIARKNKIKVVGVPPVIWGGKPVSSSRIRSLLKDGDIEHVNALLGRPIEFSGMVVHGNRRGKRLGFPTANIHLFSHLFPPRGVYKIFVRLGNRTFDAVMNVGYRPTFCSGKSRLICEAFILDFHTSIYGKKLTIGLIKRLRSEHRFKSPDDLIKQIQRDIQSCHFYSSKRSSRPR